MAVIRYSSCWMWCSSSALTGHRWPQEDIVDSGVVSLAERGERPAISCRIRELSANIWHSKTSYGPPSLKPPLSAPIEKNTCIQHTQRQSKPPSFNLRTPLANLVIQRREKRFDCIRVQRLLFLVHLFGIHVSLEPTYIGRSPMKNLGKGLWMRSNRQYLAKMK